MRSSLRHPPVIGRLAPMVLGAALLVAHDAEAAAPDSPSLVRAYAKELAFLKAEKAELDRRLATLDEESRSRLAAAAGQVSELEGRLAGLRSANLEMEDRLRALAESRPADADHAVQANDAVQSAREVLRQAGRSPRAIGDLARLSPDEVEAPLVELFEQLRAEIQAGSETSARSGRFFLTDGRQVEGQIIRVGGVASFGASREGSGALAQVSGQPKLLPDPAAETAVALAAGQVPPVLQVFLRDASAEEGAGLSDGKGTAEADHGIIGALMKLPIFEAEWVLYLLIAMSLVSAAVMVERFSFYRRHSIDVDSVRAQLETYLGKGDFDGASKYLAGFDSLETNAILFGLREHARGPEAVEDLIRGAEAREKARYSRFLGFLATVGSNAPFIGLFGTVLGIIKAFQDLSATMANAGGSVMAGISEALIATAVGLLVAIPAVIAFNAFSGKVKKVASGAELLARILLSSLKSDEVARRGA